MGSSDISHIVNTEEKLTNLHDAETRVTVGDSRTLNRTKHCNLHGYQKRDGKLDYMMLYDTDVILVLLTNIFGVKGELQKVYQMMS